MTGSAAEGFFALCVIALVVGFIYFLPSLMGSSRRVTNREALFFVNLLIGWTILGWCVCLLWAVCGKTEAQDEYFRTRSKVKLEQPK